MKQGGLYEISFEVTDHAANVCHVNKAELWLKRYGHISFSALNDLISKTLVDDLNIRPEKLDFCDVCVKGKQSREPFNGTRPRVSRPFERIHSDVCDPICSVAWNGCR